jgi:2-phosphoglycerate kinase
MKGFPNIRRVQKYIKSQALSHNVPVIPNYSLDQALSALIDLVVEKATERVRASATGKAKTASAREAIEMEATNR